MCLFILFEITMLTIHNPSAMKKLNVNNQNSILPKFVTAQPIIAKSVATAIPSQNFKIPIFLSI